MASEDHGTGAAEAAAESIREMIRRRELLPGEPVRQQDMAERLEVSRVPIREALNSLQKEGLLRHVRNRGYFVAKLSSAQLGQIYLMRELLETALLSEIVWPDDDAIDALAAINSELASAAEKEQPGRVATLNREFHEAIFSLSPLDLIHIEVNRLWQMSDSYRAFYLAGPSRHHTAVEHDGIIEALRARDRDLLVGRLNEHRARARNEVGAMLGGPAVAPAAAGRVGSAN
ncbi:MAG: GntR family transcriptional regulator [Actinomycetota bacterium]|nr:GntR family transcriptional regulator [Actinomycetota bacterium]